MKKTNKLKLNLELLNPTTDPDGVGDGIYPMGGNYYAVSPIKKKKRFQIKFSQTTVSPTTTDIVTTLDDLTNKMRKESCAKIPPVNAAFINGDLVVHDHRRVMAAIVAKRRIFMLIHSSNIPRIEKRLKSNKLSEPLTSMPEINGNVNPFIGANLEAYQASSQLFKGVTPERSRFLDCLDAALTSSNVKKKRRSKGKPKKTLTTSFCLNDTDSDLKLKILSKMR